MGVRRIAFPLARNRRLSVLNTLLSTYTDSFGHREKGGHAPGMPCSLLNVTIERDANT